MEGLRAEVQDAEARMLAGQGRIERQSTDSDSDSGSRSDTDEDADVSSARWQPPGSSGDVSRLTPRSPALMSARLATPSTHRPGKFGNYADDF